MGIRQNLKRGTFFAALVFARVGASQIFVFGQVGTIGWYVK